MKILLASASPRRKELIKFISDEVRVIPSTCEETVPENLNGRETVEYLSLLKGNDVKDKAENGETVVSADTVVCLDGKILGKPKTEDEAFSMLRFLSGKTHSVYTGVTLIKGKKTLTFSQETKVVFYELTDKEIKEYIDTKEPMDKAGAYGIQGKGCVLIKEINGDYLNVVGLPVSLLKRKIEEFLNENCC